MCKAKIKIKNMFKIKVNIVNVVNIKFMVKVKVFRYEIMLLLGLYQIWPDIRSIIFPDTGYPAWPDTGYLA